MTPSDKEQVLAHLRRLKPELLTRFKVRQIGLFGSFVREQQKEASDIDILVDFDEKADLFDLVGLALFLEEELHHEVDVVSKKALREELRETVLQEVVLV